MPRRQVCNLTRKLPHGFEDAITFTDSTAFFEGLWEEWLNTKLYLLAKGTPMLEKGCKGILESLTNWIRFPEYKSIRYGTGFLDAVKELLLYGE
ncbi:MAG: hypothetical protein OSJ61_21140 [Lachnospiraceae bacterium]|nr:hypothetical protein [Lachnospiraceae bacterium]